MFKVLIFSVFIGVVFSCSSNGLGSPVGSVAVGPPGNPGVPGLPGLIAMPTPNVTNREKRDVEKIPLDQDSFIHVSFNSDDVKVAKKSLKKISTEMTEMVNSYIKFIQ